MPTIIINAGIPTGHLITGLLAFARRRSPLAAKGRLILCTVPGSTPNCSAILRTPGRLGSASAPFILLSSSGAIDGRPSRLPSLLALPNPAHTLLDDGPLQLGIRPSSATSPWLSGHPPP